MIASKDAFLIIGLTFKIERPKEKKLLKIFK